MEFCRDPGRDLPDPGRSYAIKFLGRELDCRISGMDPGKLDMLRDGETEDLPSVGNSIELDLIASTHERTDDNRMLLRHLNRLRQKLTEIFMAVTDVHRSSGEDIGWTDQDREPDLGDKGVDGLHRRQLFPFRLVDAEPVDDRREFIPVFRTVDIFG